MVQSSNVSATSAIDSLDYDLRDFGGGRKWERFGRHSLIRPCAAANSIRPTASVPWEADAEYVLDASNSSSRGIWRSALDEHATWTMQVGSIRVELKLTEFGHVGIFPEHADHWRWVAGSAASLRDARILNLFAYTGVFSLILAAAGASVTHVDSSKSAVRWARRNAALSGMTDAPIRWIVEDANAYVQRELRRGVRYDGFVIDAPTYGHGPKGQSWKIERDLAPLIEQLVQLVDDSLRLWVVTSHTESFSADRLKRMTLAAFAGRIPRSLDAGEVALVDARQRRLPSGSFARWSA